jgi:hypothetical protein
MPKRCQIATGGIFHFTRVQRLLMYPNPVASVTCLPFSWHNVVLRTTQRAIPPVMSGPSPTLAPLPEVLGRLV